MLVCALKSARTRAASSLCNFRAHAATRVLRQHARLTTAAGSTEHAQRRQRLITTPIYYVTSPPHLGHVFSSVTADALARYERARDPHSSVLLSTGTDEHGLKVQQAAERAGRSPADFVSDVSATYRSAADAFRVAHTHFIRTTSRTHAAVTAWLWRRLAARGAIVMGTHESWYCTSDEAFLTHAHVCTREAFVRARARERGDADGGDAEIGGMTEQERKRMVSVESGHPVEWLQEHNYMFRLSGFTQDVRAWLVREGSVLPASRRTEMLRFCDDGLRDLSVSRRSDKVQWALPVPGDASHRVYVWLDALANYLTAALAPDIAATCEQMDQLSDDVDWRQAFPAWPAACHVVGKDILRFHAIYWPAFLLAAGLPPPQCVLAHGHWTVARTKMSKSLGNVVDPLVYLQPPWSLTPDAMRYFLLREGSLTGDGDFSPDTLRVRAISECADTLGNLAARALTDAFLPGGKLSAHVADPIANAAHSMPALGELAELLRNVRQRVDEALAAGQLSHAMEAGMRCVAEANRQFANAEPWKLRKQPGDAARVQLAILMYHVLEALRIGAIVLAPAMPDACSKLLDTMRVLPRQREWEAAVLGAVAPHEYEVSSKSGLVLFPKPKPAK